MSTASMASPAVLDQTAGIPRLATLVLPYTRQELPGWGRLLRILGLYGDEPWGRAPSREIRGKWHGYRMMLDLSDVNDRLAYFCGRYQEAATQVFMLNALRPGDTFVDVGANTGMLTLLGARCVGPAGRVYSFEPNPHVFERLRSHVLANGLSNVRAVRGGLSDSPGALMLHVGAKNSGWGTFAEPGPGAGELTLHHRAQVLRGDDALGELPGAPLTIKIDVEGFECRVIRGLSKTLARYHPAVMTEAVPEHLERANSSLRELFELMGSHGYRAVSLNMSRRWWRYSLRLTPTPCPSEVCSPDLAWLHPEGVHIGRLPASIFSGESRLARAG